MSASEQRLASSRDLCQTCISSPTINCLAQACGSVVMEHQVNSCDDRSSVVFEIVEAILWHLASPHPARAPFPHAPIGCGVMLDEMSREACALKAPRPTRSLTRTGRTVDVLDTPVPLTPTSRLSTGCVQDSTSREKNPRRVARASRTANREGNQRRNTAHPRSRQSAQPLLVASRLRTDRWVLGSA